MKDRILYNLGWDYSLYGYAIDLQEAPQDMQIGYREGSSHFRDKTKQADIFVRKWLQLRFNAIKRNRQFDDDVTPDFLQEIVTTLCPVSRLPLTVGMQLDSDWSIDRIINDGAYSRGNLMVLSTRVNRMKGSMSLEDIRARKSMEIVDSRLSAQEWQRLFTICQEVYDAAGLVPAGKLEILPMVITPVHLKVELSQVVQNLLLHNFYSRMLPTKHSAKPIKGLNALRSTCYDLKSSRLLHKIMTRMEKHCLEYEFPEDLFWDSTTFSLFLELYAYQVLVTKRWPNAFEDIKGKDLNAQTQAAFR